MQGFDTSQLVLVLPPRMHQWLYLRPVGHCLID